MVSSWDLGGRGKSGKVLPELLPVLSLSSTSCVTKLHHLTTIVNSYLYHALLPICISEINPDKIIQFLILTDKIHMLAFQVSARNSHRDNTAIRRPILRTAKQPFGMVFMIVVMFLMSLYC